MDVGKGCLLIAGLMVQIQSVFEQRTKPKGASDGQASALQGSSSLSSKVEKLNIRAVH